MKVAQISIYVYMNGWRKNYKQLQTEQKLAVVTFWHRLSHSHHSIRESKLFQRNTITFSKNYKRLLLCVVYKVRLVQLNTWWLVGFGPFRHYCNCIVHEMKRLHLAPVFNTKVKHSVPTTPLRFNWTPATVRLRLADGNLLLDNLGFQSLVDGYYCAKVFIM